MSSQPAVFSKGATFPPESARGLPRTLFSDVYGYCAGTIWHRSVVAAFAFLQFGPDTVASDGGASSQKSIEQRVPIGATACHLGGVYALGSSVRSIAMATTAGAEPPSFTALATYLPAVGAMACPMHASIKRPCIAAWSRRGRLG